MTRLQDLARAVIRRVVGCRHTRSVRERRTRYGCAVLHYRCLDCGHVAPIVDRSEAETIAMFCERDLASGVTRSPGELDSAPPGRAVPDDQHSA